MTSRNSRATATDDSGALPAPLALLADLPRRQMALATQSASALFRGSEALRKIQQQAAHRASVHHEEAVERLREPCDFNDLLSIQADLLRFNLQEMTQYWQQVASAALKVQVDMVGTAGEAADNGPDPTLDLLQRAFAESLNSGAQAAH